MSRSGVIGFTIVLFVLVAGREAGAVTAKTLPRFGGSTGTGHGAVQVVPAGQHGIGGSGPVFPGPGSGEPGGGCGYIAPFCSPNTGPTCPHVCIPLQPGETQQEAIARFEREYHCVVRHGGASSCSVEWRVSESFLAVSEGKLVTKGYVPTCRKKKGCKQGKKTYKYGEVFGQSGVTISTGVDLGQQSKRGTRAVIDKYIAEFGNKDKVDVDALMKKLDPYFGKKKQDAVDALKKKSLKVTSGEAKLLASAFGYVTQVNVAKQFDKHAKDGMVFKTLPEAAQTVIVDFAYQYGLSDSKGSVRKKFWSLAYAGKWEELANWLKGPGLPYHHRRTREGDLLSFGIGGGLLPKSGNPCTQPPP